MRFIYGSYSVKYSIEDRQSSVFGFCKVRAQYKKGWYSARKYPVVSYAYLKLYIKMQYSLRNTSNVTYHDHYFCILVQSLHLSIFEQVTFNKTNIRTVWFCLLSIQQLQNLFYCQTVAVRITQCAKQSGFS